MDVPTFMDVDRLSAIDLALPAAVPVADAVSDPPINTRQARSTATVGSGEPVFNDPGLLDLG